MSTHQSRMAELGRRALPPKGSRARAVIDAALSRNAEEHPEIKDAIETIWEQATALISAQQDNGAGFELDATIRWFDLEYCHRVVEKGLYSLPASFNVMEAYFSYLVPHAIFKIRKELDYLFSIQHFLEWVTDPDFSIPIEEAADHISVDKIYSYTNIDALSKTEFSSNTSKSFTVGGFSLVRHGSEVTVLLLAGERTDLSAKTIELEQYACDFTPAPDREDIRPSEDLRREAVPLRGSKDQWKVLAIIRFDLSDRTHQVKYVLHDIGDCFDIVTDDPATFMDSRGEFLGPEYSLLFEESQKRVVEYSILFELCTTAIYLGAYFDEFGDDIVQERHKTLLAEKLNLLSFRKKKQLIPPSERIAYRTVSVFRPSVAIHVGRSTSYLPPRFKIEKSGYWKRLLEDEIGADKHGNEIHGRTWVHKQLSWVESTASPTPVRVTPGEPNEQRGRDPGIIYVMRSAVHPRNVFKVGLTRRGGDARAEALSRETGSPDRFYVMQEWQASDCAKAERLIHSRLSHYRVNPKREFFEAPYKEIFAVVDTVINEIEEGCA